jgi:hypothetical protein
MAAVSALRRTVCVMAREAYIYAYPLVLMDVTRKQLTNFVTPPGTPGQGPANQFINLREFSDPKFKIVIRPNADTLYSSAWLDLKTEPVVLSVPATDHYFMLPMLSMCSDVFAVPGTRIRTWTWKAMPPHQTVLWLSPWHDCSAWCEASTP